MTKKSNICSINYLRNTNRILLTNGPMAKIFSPQEQENKPLNFALFANYPTSITDEISLQIGRYDLEFLLEKLPWTTLNASLLVLTKFLHCAQSTFNTKSGGVGALRIEYFSALQSVQVMLKAAIELYQACEMSSFQIEIRDINHSTDLPAIMASDESLSFRDANLLVNILLDLEEQLWAMSLGSVVP